MRIVPRNFRGVTLRSVLLWAKFAQDTRLRASMVPPAAYDFCGNFLRFFSHTRQSIIILVYAVIHYHI